MFLTVLENDEWPGFLTPSLPQVLCHAEFPVPRLPRIVTGGEEYTLDTLDIPNSGK